MQQVVEDNILMARKNDIRAIEANLKPLGRNLSSSQMCTLQTMKNLRRINFSECDSITNLHDLCAPN